MKTKNFPTQRKMINSIIRSLNSASAQQFRDGKQWYFIANNYADQLSEKFDISLAKTCGVMAALSANKSWKENKRIARIFLQDGRVLHTFVTGLKAKNILSGHNISETLNGEKTKAFYKNLLNPACPKNVTIDRHAWRVAGLDCKWLTPNQYKLVANAYMKATNEYNRKNNTSLTPSQVQAITWIVQRGSKD